MRHHHCLTVGFGNANSWLNDSSPLNGWFERFKKASLLRKNRRVKSVDPSFMSASVNPGRSEAILGNSTSALWSDNGPGVLEHWPKGWEGGKVLMFQQ